MKRLSGFLAAVALLSGTIGIARATASPVLRAALRLNASMSYSRFPSGRTLVRLPALNLAPGESRFVFGHLRARNRSRWPANEQVGITCDYGDHVESTRTSRNNLGSRVRYSNGWGVMDLNVRYLATASRASTVLCTLWGQSSGRSMVALRGSGTYIEVTKAAQPLAAQWVEGRCDSRGGGSRCIYLVPPGIRQSHTHFPSHVYALVGTTFTADPRARAVDVMSDVELTTCYRTTLSCARKAARYGGGYGSVAIVETRLEIQQLDLFGKPCAVTYFPRPGRGDGTAHAFMRSVITHADHHYKIHMETLHVPKLVSPCSNRYLVRTFVHSLAGDPVKIEGTRMNTPTHHQWSYTNAIARNVY